MHLEVFVPDQQTAKTSNYLMHILDKQTGQRLFTLSSGFEVVYVPGCEEIIARVFFRLMMQSSQLYLEFRNGPHWFILHYDGHFEVHEGAPDSLIHVLLYAAFLLYDRQPV